MIAEGGGFAASLDADSEGVEGKFYVWTLPEILEALGPEDGRFFAEVYDVSRIGNWEERNILNRLSALELRSDADEARLAGLRAKLLAVRGRRVHPGWDDKVLADWNGLTIAALARAAFVFDEPRWLGLAKRAFDFVTTRMMVDGRLVHAYRDGRAKAPATASDYANMTWAALRLLEATTEPRYLAQARAFVDVLDRHYWMAEHGGYATSADDTDDVIVRLRSGADDATPNANPVMLSNLIWISFLTGETSYLDRAAALLAAFTGEIGRNIVAHTGLLAAAIDLLSPLQAIISGKNLEGGQELIEAIRRLSLPGGLQLAIDSGGSGLAAMRDKPPVNQRATAYVCSGPQCSLPLTEPNEFVRTLKAQRSL
jgi:hypothetical protein